jgi:small subunit ribosomal protein S1
MTAKPRRSRNSDPAFSVDDFAKALEEQNYQFEVGQIVWGKVVDHSTNGVYVDIGAKSPAFLPAEEVVLKKGGSLSETLPLQSEDEFLIVRDQNADGQLCLSQRRLKVKRLWQQLVQMQTENQILSVKVTQVNKGGVLVNVKGLRGFIPRSHLNSGEDLQSLVGQTLTAGLLQVSPEAHKLVLSQRMVTQTEKMTEFQIGQLVEGEISAVKPFGLFIEFGGATGLLHIKQISQKYITSLPSLFQVGQPLKAVIQEIDESKGRLSLSLRVLEKYPGEVLEHLPTILAEASERVRKLKGKLGSPDELNLESRVGSLADPAGALDELHSESGTGSLEDFTEPKQSERKDPSPSDLTAKEKPPLIVKEKPKLIVPPKRPSVDPEALKQSSTSG